MKQKTPAPGLLLRTIPGNWLGDVDGHNHGKTPQTADAFCLYVRLEKVRDITQFDGRLQMVVMLTTGKLGWLWCCELQNVDGTPFCDHDSMNDWRTRCASKGSKVLRSDHWRGRFPS